jgi:Acid Phosphatase
VAVSASGTRHHLAALRLLKLPPREESAYEYFDHVNISRDWTNVAMLGHFRQLKTKTGFDYSDILLVGEGTQCGEIERNSGVTWVSIGPDGLTRKCFDEGIEKWRCKRKYA